MGLIKDDSLCPIWHERGYLTIIRRNWHLLPYEQILALLDWTPDEMAYVLKEDDFFWHKLGSMKPETSAVHYAPLTESEKTHTDALAKIISGYFGHKQLRRDFSERHQLGGIHFNVIQASRLFLFSLKTQARRLYHILSYNHAGKLPAFRKSNSLPHPDNQNAQDKPFGFLERYGNKAAGTSISEGNRSSGLRLTYSYSAVYGDLLLNEKLDPYPDGLLADYAAAGINAVWLQGTLYTVPQNFGPMSLLPDKPTGYKATMIGFPYDDLESWRGNHYPEDIFEEQFRKLSTGWARGFVYLEEAGKIIPADRDAAFEDLANVAEAAYCHFRSTYLQIRFVRLRKADDKEQILKVLDEEIELAQRLHAVMLRDSRIGFEASNHYYYTANDLKEKVLNCEHMKTLYFKCKIV